MKFHTVTIPRSIKRSDEVNPHMHGFVDEVNKTRIQRKARVYQTYVSDGDKKYAFVTTSKDLHLGLGEMTKEAQVLMARLLEYEYNRGNFGQLILGIQKNEGDEYSYTLVAMSTYCGEMSFGFSPVH